MECIIATTISSTFYEYVSLLAVSNILFLRKSYEEIRLLLKRTKLLRRGAF